ncbi:MAG: SMP-30/gluconolactonase/LRE family protein [Deltaproteobacteria bacterium]|nr:SMP-30/gluconolactonase/LRE family protein [Deltaproteobacteria bacterium]
MKRRLLITAISLGILIIANYSVPAGAQVSKSVVPLPPALANLPKLEVEPWLRVDSQELFLEGPAFDRKGNLFVSSIFDNRILKITPDKKVVTVFKQEGLLPDGIAIHRDGRLFLACLSGKVVAVNPDGSNMTEIKVKYQGFPRSANDLVFDSRGNLYVTDFIGTAADPKGGVYRYSADFKTIKPVFRNLASANGIGLFPEGNVLWVTETGRNAIHRLQLLEDGVTIVPIAGSGIPYRFVGAPGGCDSMALDSKGNVYQAIIFQGRILILNSGGIPVAQVLIPGRDEGKLLRTTNVAFKPGTNEVYITASGKGGAWIYRFKGLAEGLRLFSHQ